MIGFVVQGHIFLNYISPLQSHNELQHIYKAISLLIPLTFCLRCWFVHWMVTCTPL